VDPEGIHLSCGGNDTMKQSEAEVIRILLVDDEEDLVEFLAHRLLKRGFTVTATVSGQEALEVVKRQTFDVAILDQKMPGMDGIELLEKVKEIQPFLEVIMLTGHGSIDTALEAGRLEAFRYLTKPYDYDDLLARIHEAHASKKEQLQAGYQKELASAMERNLSPRELMALGEELRHKYERD
jgi:DNA-binding NtrC family response regulator